MKKETKKLQLKKVMSLALLFVIALIIKNHMPNKKGMDNQNSVPSPQHNKKRKIFFYQRPYRQKSTWKKLFLSLSSLFFCAVLSYAAIQTQSSRNYTQVASAPYNEFWVGVDTQTEINAQSNKFRITSMSMEIAENRGIINTAVSSLLPAAKKILSDTITPLTIKIDWQGTFSKDWKVAIVLPWDFCVPNNQQESEKSCLSEDISNSGSALYFCSSGSSNNNIGYFISERDITNILFPHVQVPNFSLHIPSNLNISEGKMELDPSLVMPVPTENSTRESHPNLEENNAVPILNSAIIIPGHWLSLCASGNGSITIKLPIYKEITSQSSFSEAFMKIKYRTSGWELTSLSGESEKFIVQLNDSNQLGKFTVMKPDEITLKILSGSLLPLSAGDGSSGNPFPSSAGDEIKLVQSPTGLRYTFYPEQSVLIEIKDNRMIESANKLIFFIGIFISTAVQILITYFWEKL